MLRWVTATHGGGPMIAGGSLAIYAAMMKSMDAGIGRVLQALAAPVSSATRWSIFTSDNGGERYSFNWPFSFQKCYLWEGGIRVPAIVRWPGTIPAGRSDRSSGDHDGLDGDDPGGGRRGDRSRLSARWRGRDAGPAPGARAVYDRTLFWRTQTQARGAASATGST